MSIRMRFPRSSTRRLVASAVGLVVAASLAPLGAGATGAAAATATPPVSDTTPAPDAQETGTPHTDAPTAGDWHLDLEAGSVASFRAGDIISDANLWNGSAMTGSEVQAFLTATTPACSGTDCIDITSFPPSPGQSANEDCSAVSAGYTRAATMVAAVGRACDVSQKALLVLIQKESSLITSSDPADDEYDRATGYECPDTSSCDPAYRGFFLQVYNAARQLSDSRSEPPAAFPVGETVDIRYSPDESCGSAPVTIRTLATAALYEYTPYQPNDAAEVDGSDGDACSSLGNLNFWFVYTDWFGYPHIDVDRIEGADRFAVAVNIAERAYPDGAETVYLATGTGYADALSAGPAAVRDGAPLLLTRPEALPQPVADEIAQRLKPSRIVIVGGPNSVSPAVEAQLKTLVPAGGVVRIGGADRFAVSRNLADYAFPSGAAGAYVATGLNFPDALSASGAGGHLGRPVVLVNGGLPTLDGDTRALLGRLGVQQVFIAGGPASVSEGIRSSIASLPGTSVQRLAGADRFAASLAVNADAYGTSDRVFLATGLGFPDALAGSALAGAQGSPLIVVPQDCLPRDVRLSFRRFDNTAVTLLGGPASLGAGVEALAGC